MNLNKQPQKGQDPPINATGVQQSHDCSAYLDKLLGGSQIDAVFYSPLQRAVQTMEIIMAGRAKPRVSETAKGLRQGCYLDDVHDFLSYSFRKIREENLSNVLVVSHGPVIKYMFQWLADIGRLENTESGRFHTPRNTAIAEVHLTEPNNCTLKFYDSLP